MTGGPERGVKSVTRASETCRTQERKGRAKERIHNRQKKGAVKSHGTEII